MNYTLSGSPTDLMRTEVEQVWHPLAVSVHLCKVTLNDDPV